METPVSDELNPDQSTDPGRAKNYALDSRVLARIRKEIIPLLQFIRDRRRPLNNLWAQCLRVWTLQHDEPTYTGRSNIYVPAGKKSVETITTQLVSQTFPGSENFYVRDGGGATYMDPTGCQAILNHQIDNVAHVRTKAEPFYRSLVGTGNSPVKLLWKKKVVRSIRARGPYGIGSEEDVSIYDGPVFHLVDPSNFYVWPENLDDPDECEMKFEDLTVSFARLMQRARQKIYSMDAVKKLRPNRELSDKRISDAVKLEAQGMTGPKDTGMPDAYGLCDITEIWLDFDPSASSREEEDNPVPFLITVSGNEVLRAIENPNWHKQDPYLFGRMGVLQGRSYGTGLVEGIRELNILLNAQTNVGMDCANLAMNPMMLVNDEAIEGEIGDLEPALQIKVRDLNNAIKFVTSSTEPINMSSVLSAQTASWLQDYAFSPPVLSGGSAPGRAFRTATGVGTAQTNAQGPLREIVRAIEPSVWSRMLYRFSVMTEQFGEDDYLTFFGEGRKIQKFGRRAVMGNWIYRWMASTQSDNKQLIGSNIIQALSTFANPAMQQLFQANKRRFNPVPLAKILIREIWGLRSISDEVIADATAEILGARPPGQRPIPEVTGGPPETQDLPPGLQDNDAFMGTRQASDEISAQLGALLNQSGDDQELYQ